MYVKGKDLKLRTLQSIQLYVCVTVELLCGAGADLGGEHRGCAPSFPLPEMIGWPKKNLDPLCGGTLLPTFEESVQLQLAQAARDTQTMLYGSLPCLSEATKYM